MFYFLFLFPFCRRIIIETIKNSRQLKGGGRERQIPFFFCSQFVTEISFLSQAIFGRLILSIEMDGGVVDT
jgi:hypothetical protein